jgi:hypothetical protein
MNRAILTVSLFWGALVACSDSSTAPNPVIGRYELVSVNGIALPAQIVKADTTVVFVADTLNVNADGTYSQHEWTRVTIGTVTAPDSSVSIGTYTHNGTMYMFTDAADQSTVAGTFANGGGDVSGSGAVVLGVALTLAYTHL